MSSLVYPTRWLFSFFAKKFLRSRDGIWYGPEIARPRLIVVRVSYDWCLFNAGNFQRRPAFVKSAMAQSISLAASPLPLIHSPSIGSPVARRPESINKERLEPPPPVRSFANSDRHRSRPSVSSLRLT